MLKFVLVTMLAAGCALASVADLEEMIVEPEDFPEDPVNFADVDPNEVCKECQIILTIGINNAEQGGKTYKAFVEGVDHECKNEALPASGKVVCDRLNRRPFYWPFSQIFKRRAFRMAVTQGKNVTQACIAVRLCKKQA